MQQIENSDTKVVFEVKGYRVCSPAGTEKKHSISMMRIRLYIIAVAGYGLAFTIWGNPLNGMGSVLRNIGWILYAIILLFYLYIIVAGIIWLRPANLSKVPHRYTISIDKQKRSLEYFRFGWRFFIPVLDGGGINLGEVKQTSLSEYRGCYVLALTVFFRPSLQFDVPDEETGKMIQYVIEEMIAEKEGIEGNP